MRYEAILGFNTKQWWVYDNEEDTYIDPPSSVLESLSDETGIAEEQLNNLLVHEPDWLNDEDYIYAAEETEI